MKRSGAGRGSKARSDPRLLSGPSSASGQERGVIAPHRRLRNRVISAWTATMAADEASEGTAVTIVQSMETEEEDPDGGVAVKVLDLPLVDPPMLRVNTERMPEDETMETDATPGSSTEKSTDLNEEKSKKTQKAEDDVEIEANAKTGKGDEPDGTDGTDKKDPEDGKSREDETVTKSKKPANVPQLETDGTVDKVEDVEEAAEVEEAVEKTEIIKDEEDAERVDLTLDEADEPEKTVTTKKGDITSPIEIDEDADDVEMSDDIEDKPKSRVTLTAPPLDDEDTIDSSGGHGEEQSTESGTEVASSKTDAKDGESSAKRVTRKSATKTPTPTPQSDPDDDRPKSEASVEAADEANIESHKSDNKLKSNKSSGVTSTDDEDGAHSTDNPSQSPRDRVSDASSSSPSKSFETSSEHMKMRGRLQKELRKLGIDTLDSKPEEANPEEEEKPAGRPSRNAARVAARKITNVVAKSNMTMESLAASDGEDYSGDGISTRLAAQKKAANRKKLTYVSGQKALINNDLMMDCMEEALAPCQIDAFRNAVHHYNTITNQIHQMQKRKLQVTFNNRPLTNQEYDLMMNSTKKDDEKYKLETATSKVCRGGWSLVTVQRLGVEQLRPNIVMTQSAPFGDLPDEGETDMTRLEEEFAIHQLDTNPVPFLVKHKFLRPTVGTKSRHLACDCNADTDINPAESTLDGYVWKCSKCSRTWNIQRPEQTLFSWYAKIPLYKFLNVIKSWVLAHSCEETASLTGVDTFIVRSIWRSIQELCHKDVIKRILPLGASGDVVEVTAAHMDPFVVLAALDKKTNTFRAKVFPAVTTSEVDLAKAASAWLSKDSVIATKSSIMRTTFIEEQKFAKVPLLTETLTLDEFLLIHLSDHFGNFRLESSHKPILEGFLYEIQWRRAFGRFGPRESFWRMIAQLLPTSQEGMDFLAQVASQFVTPGGQIPLGVRQPLIERRNSNDDVVVIRDQEEETVVLENYYYARRDGERHVQKHKKYMRDGEMFFRCPVCKKVAKNNISIMKHISMHLESNREFNPDVSHMCICRTCFRDFETPYDCQVHVQQVHLAAPEGERLCCKICSLGYNDEEQLVYHMKTTHTARDMPFVCKICHYRSSFKHHVLDHFREKHSGCNALQCPYCLEMYYCQAKQVVTGVQGTTKFYSHLFKHMNNTPKTCTQCSLPFIKQKELRAHKVECHNKNVVGKGKMTGCGWSSENPVIVNKPRKKPTSPPASEKKEEEPPENSADAKVNWLVPSLRLPEDVEDYDCRECLKPITQEHFCRVLRCTECHFFTCCQSSFTGHMLKQHAQRLSTIPRTIPTTPLLDNKQNPEKFVGRCKKCDEKFEDGNSLVKHLVLSCGVNDGATIELGKRKAAMKHTQVKRRRGAEQEEEHKFEDVVGEPFTEVFNTSSSNSVGSTPIKTNVPKQAKGQKSGGSTEMNRFLNQLGLRSSSESCSQFKVSYAGPKCVKQQWISMGLVQQEIESSSESEDENEKPEKKEAREKARKERAIGLLPKTKETDEDHIGEADSPPSSSSSDSSVTDVDLD